MVRAPTDGRVVDLKATTSGVFSNPTIGAKCQRAKHWLVRSERPRYWLAMA